jgi:peptide/nickel transport system substrate-binding protein
LAYAIPYSAIVTNVYKGYAARADSYVAPGTFGYNPIPGYFNFNMTKAQNLLKQAGFSTGKISPAVTATVHLFAIYPETLQTWELIQPYWAQLGVNLNIQSMDIDPLFAAAHGANPQDIWGVRWNPSCLSAGCQLLDNYGNASFVNLSYWTNSTFEGLENQALALEGSNPAQAKIVFAQAQDMLFQSAPGVTMLFLQKVFGINSHWSGYVYDQYDPNRINVYSFRYSP